MPTDKELLDWIDATVGADRGNDRNCPRGVRFYWGSRGGGFRLLECGQFGTGPRDDVFPTIREALADAMEKYKPLEGTGVSLSEFAVPQEIMDQCEHGSAAATLRELPASAESIPGTTEAPYPDTDVQEPASPMSDIVNAEARKAKLAADELGIQIPE